MIEVRVDDIHAAVEAARQMVAGWETFVGDLEMLARQHEAHRMNTERLEQENDDLRRGREYLLRERDATREALAVLETAQQSLLGEHEGTNRALAELRANHGTLLAEREVMGQALVELETNLERLRREHEAAMRESDERYQATLQDREHAADQLEGILRRLRC